MEVHLLEELAEVVLLLREILEVRVMRNEQHVFFLAPDLITCFDDDPLSGDNFSIFDIESGIVIGHFFIIRKYLLLLLIIRKFEERLNNQERVLIHHLEVFIEDVIDDVHKSFILLTVLKDVRRCKGVGMSCGGT